MARVNYLFKSIGLPFSFFILLLSCNQQYQKVNDVPEGVLGTHIIDLTISHSENLNDIDYDGFEDLTSKLKTYRKERLLYLEDFRKMMTRKNTILLDTRSKRAYDQIHIKGAVHLNFSDFTEEKLAEVIPNKKTKILIYCNNNFDSRLTALRKKRGTLALNIPTFINLYGYGYKNIYELYTPERIHPKDKDFEYEGILAAYYIQKPKTGMSK